MSLTAKFASFDVLAAEDVVEVHRLEFAESVEELDAFTAEFTTTGDQVGEVWTKVQPGTAATIGLTDAEGTSKGTAKGVVVSVEIEQDGPDRFRFTVVALEELVKLRGAVTEAAWEDAPDKIVKAIAQAVGFQAQADGSNVVKYRLDQTGQDDVVFLKTLASRFHYRVGTADGKIVFKRLTTVDKTVTIAAEDVYEQRIGASVHGLVTEAIVWGRDPKQNGWFQEKVTDGGRAISGTSITGMSLAKKVYKAAKVELRDYGCTTPGAAQERATAELKRRLEQFVSGTIIVRGNPEVRTGTDVSLSSDVWPFKGKYRVREARHVLADGRDYRTEIDVYSDSLPVKS